MHTRTCSACGESKSIAGVWYLEREGATPSNKARFHCEPCHAARGSSPRRVALVH